jgi:hypothetical protein
MAALLGSVQPSSAAGSKQGGAGAVVLVGTDPLELAGVDVAGAVLVGTGVACEVVADDLATFEPQAHAKDAETRVKAAVTATESDLWYVRRALTAGERIRGHPTARVGPAGPRGRPLHPMATHL